VGTPVLPDDDPISGVLLLDELDSLPFPGSPLVLASDGVPLPAVKDVPEPCASPPAAQPLTAKIRPANPRTARELITAVSLAGVGVGVRSWVAACALLGCAAGQGVNASVGGGIGDEGDGPTSGSFDPIGGSSSSGDPTDGDEDPSNPAPPDVGPCDDDIDCLIEDGGCFDPQGLCVDHSCEFTPELAGVPCNDGDDCTDQDVCNGMGGCLGAEVDCMFEHGSSACVAGGCAPIECDDGWGDCNGDEVDGCETPLNTAADCGACGASCSVGPNATASCDDAGQCTQSCEAPYENCDDDWTNGCEIPTGTPNQCDAGGLNPSTGCWTAHCGSSNNPDARNFGTWFCFECTTCNVPSAGNCRWCSHETGTWFPQDACACGGYEDLVCSP
jgi:hypothetical protein